MLKVGMPAPDFALLSSKGDMISLKEFIGNNVVVYFYPKDDTPGCTQEALDFKMLINEFEGLNTKIIGISRDSVKSHHNFKTRYDLPFFLLSDANTQVIKAYGAWVEKYMFGKSYFGIERCTFFLDNDGVIQKIWHKVKPKNHAQEVLNYIKKSSKPQS